MASLVLTDSSQVQPSGLCYRIGGWVRTPLAESIRWGNEGRLMLAGESAVKVRTGCASRGFTDQSSPPSPSRYHHTSSLDRMMPHLHTRHVIHAVEQLNTTSALANYATEAGLETNFGKNTLSTLDRDSNLNHPVLGGLIQNKSNASDYLATETTIKNDLDVHSRTHTWTEACVLLNLGCDITHEGHVADSIVCLKGNSDVTSIGVSVIFSAPSRSGTASQYGTPDSEVEAAPYQPSGWRPSGRQFLLPVRQSAPVYYAPPEQYGPPSTEAAPANVTEEQEPATTTTEQPTTTDLPTTTENPDEQADGNSQDPNSQRFQQQREQEDLDTGLYYVLLPDGRLQRVAYSGSRLAAQPQQQQRQQQQLFSEQPHQLTNGYYAQIQVP
uniref:Uncharacterized protein n=1 Tax=Timema shepardi TaxID=629360 RepID=A0A7R9G3V8_TIMSH|nr:unnamed protein product [Timema shepardi]